MRSREKDGSRDYRYEGKWETINIISLERNSRDTNNILFCSLVFILSVWLNCIHKISRYKSQSVVVVLGIRILKEPVDGNEG